MGDYITVHKAAKLLNVSHDTIRRWDKKGLIKSKRDEKNYRYFSYIEIKNTYNKIYSTGEAVNNFKILKSDKKSTYQVIDLFSGAGGTSLGFQNAGLNHVLMVENDKDAAQTLKNNFDCKIIEGDIKDVDFTPYLGKIDIVEGGFPCQAFSYAGRKMGFEDARGTLFFEFARCIKECKPKIAIGENVRGLENHDNGRTLQSMIKVLKELDYQVSYRILRAQYLDVPQKRERLVLVAIRKDLEYTPFLFPREKNYTVSLKEAFHNVPESPFQEYPEKKKKVLALVPEGGYWRDLPVEVQKEYMGASYHHTGGKTGMARRLAWDEPSLTIVCSPAQKQTERCHPEETRPLSIRESARIQTFPDDWEFHGSMASQYKQIGNAVPVNLGYHIGRCAIAMLEQNPDLETMEIGEPV